jgi:hypothetical protein
VAPVFAIFLTVLAELGDKTQIATLHIRQMRHVAEEVGVFLRIIHLRRVHSHIAALAYPAMNRTPRCSQIPARLDHGELEAPVCQLRDGAGRPTIGRVTIWIKIRTKNDLARRTERHWV